MMTDNLMPGQPNYHQNVISHVNTDPQQFSISLLEQSACSARVALQTRCEANVVATKFIIFSLSSFSLSTPYYFSLTST
jgi:hypothetical protein